MKYFLKKIKKKIKEVPKYLKNILSKKVIKIIKKFSIVFLKMMNFKKKKKKKKNKVFLR
jgi:hypothetical protein